jgi:ectoine hydroxylase
MLTVESVERFRRNGFLLLPPDFLDGDVPAIVADAMPQLLAGAGPRQVMERDDVTVRSVYGVHQTSGAIRDVARQRQVLDAVRQIIGDGAYVHQSKINFKAPLAGDQWEWHQDYVYWLENDGIRRPDLINVAVFLDDVTEFNGPLTFIPGSHDRGVLSATRGDGMPLGYEDAPEWVATLTAEEKYKVSGAVLEELARSNGMVSPKGPRGSVLLFDPNLLHASSPNLSPFRRAMLIFVFNVVTNAPLGVDRPRPEFLSEPQVRPLRPLVSANPEENTR